MVFTNSRPNDSAFDATQAYPIIRSRLNARDFGKVGKVRLWLEWSVKLVPLLFQENISVFHISDIFYIGPLAWFLGRMFKKPYILYTFAEELNKQLHQPDTIWSKLKRHFYSHIIQNADGLVGVSDYTISLLERFGADRRKIVKIVPMVEPYLTNKGINLEDLRAKYHISDQERIILCAGRLVTRKGQDFLIRAVPQVQAAFPNSTLIIAGRGPDEKRLRELVIEVGTQSRTIFTGFVDEGELNALYELCEIFVMPHRETERGDTEGCPTVFLEANAHGKAVGYADGGTAKWLIEMQVGEQSHEHIGNGDAGFLKVVEAVGQLPHGTDLYVYPDERILATAVKIRLRKAQLTPPLP